MLTVGCYAKIKSAENKGNYTVCKLTVTRKDKTTNKYETDFIGKVTFLGDAHKKTPLTDQRIKVLSIGISNCYNKDDELKFLQSPKIVCFDYELQDTPNTPTLKPLDGDFVNGELPF